MTERQWGGRGEERGGRRESHRNTVQLLFIMCTDTRVVLGGFKKGKQKDADLSQIKYYKIKEFRENIIIFKEKYFSAALIHC